MSLVVKWKEDSYIAFFIMYMTELSTLHAYSYILALKEIIYPKNLHCMVVGINLNLRDAPFISDFEGAVPRDY